MHFKTFEDFSLFTGILFFNFFGFLKCLLYMLIVILLQFIESFLLLKTPSKNLRQLAIIIRFKKAFCRHLQTHFHDFCDVSSLKNFSFRNFFPKSFRQSLTFQNYWCCLELLELFHILDYRPASFKLHIHLKLPGVASVNELDFGTLSFQVFGFL